MSKKTHKNTTHTVRPIQTLVDIVMPILRRFDILSRCLEAIPSAMGDIPYRIYMVDNASPIEEANSFYAMIKPPIMVTRNKENMGFARACNQGASRGNSPLIFFLNSDVILDANSIPVMVTELDDPKIGVCGMKLVFPDDASMYNLNVGIRPAGKIQHVGLMTNIRGDFVHAFIGWDADHPKPNACREMYAVTGAALMTRRNLFTKIRGFNEVYGAGCLVGDTFIFTESGIIKLKDFVKNVNYENLELASINMDVASDDGVRKSSLFYVNGEQETLKIKLEKDFSIQGTPNHKIKVMSEEGKIVWRQLDELKIGDYVGIRYGANLWGQNKLDLDMAYFCGVYLAEGYTEKRGRITITTADKEIQEFLKDKYFFTSTDKRKISWRKQNAELYLLISNYVNLHKKSINKEISSFFLQADKETQIALLQGMFDGDGCAIKDGRINYSTSSYVMAKQVQIMLLNFGIVVGIYSRQSNMGQINYLLDFGSDSSVFYREIGFRLPRKQERSILVRSRLSPNIPFQRKYFKSLYESSPIGNRDWKNLGMYVTNPSCGVRKDAIQLLVDKQFAAGKNYSNNENLAHFGDILMCDWVWLKVKSIEDGGIQETFDIHVPSNHTYVANGFIVHNTFEDVEFCLMAKEMGYNVIVNTSACGVHYTGATSETYQIGFPMEYNRMTFLQRWASKLTWDEYKKW